MCPDGTYGSSVPSDSAGGNLPASFDDAGGTIMPFVALPPVGGVMSGFVVVNQADSPASGIGIDWLRSG